MKFFLDHDVPAAIKDALERHEYEVIQLTDLLPRSAADEDVFAAAQSNQCVMITCNRNDFLKLAARGPHLGLIILIRRRSPQAECTNLLRLIRKAGEQGLQAISISRKGAISTANPTSRHRSPLQQLGLF